MNKTILISAMTVSLAVLFALPVGSSPALVQAERQAAELEGVTVVAPRITRERGGPGERHWEYHTVEQSAFVEHGDLDLSRSADVFTLEERVQAAATAVCEGLEDQYPDGQPAVEVCIERAIADAMTIVRARALAATE